MKTKTKTLVVSTEKRFSVNQDGHIVNVDNTRSINFWKRYLKVFDKVVVVARVDETSCIDNKNFVQNDQIEVYRLSNYQGVVQGIKNYTKLRLEIKDIVEIHRNDSFLLRVPGAIGNLLGERLIKNKLKYSIEVVGDPYEVYITQKSFVSKILAYKERASLKKLVNTANSAAYVTQFDLQKKYPFKGGFQTYYSSIKLENRFFAVEKVFFSEPLIMIGVGSLEMPYKGVAVLLQALKILAEDKINFKLTWIGAGKYMAEYQNFVIKNHLENKIKFLGSVPNEAIPKYLQASNIFILPSLTEGLPRSLIEAMASRLICFGSNVGGIPELLDVNCIFGSNDAYSIVTKLKDIHSNFSSYIRYSAINFKKAQEYRPEILEKRRFNFLKSIAVNS